MVWDETETLAGAISINFKFECIYLHHLTLSIFCHFILQKKCVSEREGGEKGDMYYDDVACVVVAIGIEEEL